MIIDDDLDPKNGPRRPKDLSKHSLTELDAYIAALEAEAARAQAERTKKQAYMANVGSLFKS